MKNKKLIATGFILAAFIPVIYFLFFRDQVIPAIKGTATPWIQFIVNSLYPRLATESQRFPFNFFLQKADQVIIRLSLLTLIVSLLSWWYSSRAELQDKINSYFEQQLSFQQARYLTTFIYLYLLYTSWDLYKEYQLLSGIRDFYSAIFPFNYIYPYFPSPLVTGILFGVFIVSCVLSALRVKPLFSSLAAIFSFLYLYSIRMGFEKIDHGFTTIIYALLILPFFMYALEIARKNGNETIDAWSIQLVKIIIPMCYFMAALEKLLTSGIWWLKASNFKTLLYIHQQPIGLWVMKSDLLCFIFPVAAWLFQFCFISILKWPRLTPYFLIIGVLFHEGTYFLLGAGDPFSPWIAVYAFLLLKNQGTKDSFGDSHELGVSK